MNMKFGRASFSSSLVVVALIVLFSAFFTMTSAAPVTMTAPSGAATATYDEDRSVDGWARFTVKGDGQSSPEMQWHAAGFLEGSLGWRSVYSWNENTAINYDPTVWNAAKNWLQQNLEFTQSLAQLPKAAPGLSLGLAYLSGLHEGYNSAYQSDPSFGAGPLTFFQMFILSAGDDVMDVVTAVAARNDTLWELHQASPAFAKTRWGRRLGSSNPSDHKPGDCSAFLVNVNGEFYAGHTTWDDWEQLLRTLKSFYLPDPTGAMRHQTHSSYPTYPYSADDFSLIRSPDNPNFNGPLWVTETTADLYTKDLYQYVQPKCVLTYLRAVMANSAANSAFDWADKFSAHNSGTVNNAWIAANLGAAPGSLESVFVVEQLPGYIEMQDWSSRLAQPGGFIQGVNLFAFEKTANLSGQIAAMHRMPEKYQFAFQFSNCSRSQMYAQHAATIQTVEDMHRTMRYNKWQTDPLQLGNSAIAIASRMDLAPTSFPIGWATRACFGSMDSKVTTSSLAAAGQVWAQCGPTHDDNPPFDFDLVMNSTCKGYKTRMMPRKFDFDWTLWS